MIQDPADEIVAAVRRAGDDPTPADRQALALVRRRFGLSLPLPFAALPAPAETVPIRAAGAVDGPAIAATKWRSWRVAYRGVLPDAFLDDLVVSPPVGYWIGLGTLAPSARHHLYVAGRPGSVVGVIEVRPTRDDDLDRATVSEVEVLYLDPLVLRRGIGSDLLGRGLAAARAQDACDVRLWAATSNHSARAFYESLGWVPDGATQTVDLGGGVTMDEVRYRAPL